MLVRGLFINIFCPCAASKPSVNKAINNLKENKLINYESYGTIELTDEGENLSKKILEAYDILYVFLKEVLGLNKEDAQSEAEKIKSVIDDNTLNIKVTKKILEKYNIEVDTVKTGKDCIFKIKSGQSYDMILLDDMLPDLGGMEVVHVVKNIQGFDIPPVIAYTANVMNGIKEEYLAQGFDDYMPKPLDINQFDGIIKKYCYKQKNGE